MSLFLHDKTMRYILHITQGGLCKRLRANVHDFDLVFEAVDKYKVIHTYPQIYKQFVNMSMKAARLL
jgi:hypothetical protein